MDQKIHASNHERVPSDICIFNGRKIEETMEQIREDGGMKLARAPLAVVLLMSYRPVLLRYAVPAGVASAALAGAVARLFAA
jgi:hypothetical protein